MGAKTVVCSLCQHAIPPEWLRKHRERELKDIENYTIELIKQNHPEWTENDPTCQKCWDEYHDRAQA